MKKVIVGIISLVLSIGSIFAEDKVFIKDYYYQASENDSKVSSRQKALNEVKTQILEEIGTYIESYVNYTVKSDSEKVSNTFFEQEIKQITAGRLKVKVLEETWNGLEYYIKVEVVVNPDEILEQLYKTIENRKASVVIDSLNLLLTSQQDMLLTQNKTISNLNAQLESKHREIEAQKQEVEVLQSKLEKLNSQYKEAQQQEILINDEISRLGAKLKQMGQNVRQKARLGMTINEVIRFCGRPRLDNGSTISTYFMNYGNVWLMFEEGILTKGFSSKYWEGGYSSYSNVPNLIKNF